MYSRKRQRRVSLRPRTPLLHILILRPIFNEKLSKPVPEYQTIPEFAAAKIMEAAVVPIETLMRRLLTTTVRLRFDGCSTAYQGSLMSQ